MAVGKRQQLEIIASYLFNCVDHVMVTDNITNGSSVQFPSLQLVYLLLGHLVLYTVPTVRAKGEFTLERAKKAQSGGVYVYLYSFFNHGASWG
jgi:hypothetical protein